MAKKKQQKRDELTVEKLIIVVNKSDRTAIILNDKERQLGIISNLILPVTRVEMETFKTESFVISAQTVIEGKYNGVNIFALMPQAFLSIIIRTPFGESLGDFFVVIKNANEFLPPELFEGNIEFQEIKSVSGLAGNAQTINYLKSV